MTPIHLNYRLNRRQVGAAFQISAQRLRQNMGWRRILLWTPALGFLLIVFAFLSALPHVEGAMALVWFVGCWLIAFGCLLSQSQWHERYAKDIGEYRVTIDDDGVLVRSEIYEARYVWSVVQAISVQAGGVAIVLGNIQSALYAPDSAFPDAETWQAFLAAMREHGIAGVPDAASTENAFPAAEIPDAPSSGFFTDLAQLGRILTFRVPRTGTLTPDAWKFILLTLIFGGLCFGAQGWEYAFSGGHVIWYNMQTLLQPLALVALIAGFARWIGGKDVNGARLWLALTFLLLLLPFANAWQNWAWWENRHWLRYIPAMWIALAGGILVNHPFAPSRTGRDIAAGTVVITSLIALFFCVSIPTVWYVPYDEDEDYDDQYFHIDESVLYEQPALLAAALDKVQPGKPGVPELFFLGVGGHQQSVFLREARAVEALFAERFDTAGHSLSLVNNKDTVHTLPTANLASLRQALARMGERMNEEDTLFLLLTSHGSPDHQLSLNLWPFDFTDLSPETLRQILDDARVKRRVVVVSACYSGGFIPALQDENTLVITASAADRNSFGCSDENEFTEFGRAYFDEALRETRSFTHAFELATKRIAEREKARGLPPSLPQIWGGSQVANDR